MKKIAFAAVVISCVGRVFAADSAVNPPAEFPVTITVDAGKSLGELKPIWRMFGADEPNYATMKDGEKLLCRNGRAADERHVFPRA